MSKVPVIIAIGQKEVENKTVSVRRLGSKGQEVLDLVAFIDKIKAEAVMPA